MIPVMEDMINEALEERAKEIQFYVEGKREEDRIRFFVGGVPQTTAQHFQEKQDLPGCDNVDQRLKLYFGEAYGIAIEESGINILVPIKEGDV